MREERWNAWQGCNGTERKRDITWRKREKEHGRWKGNRLAKQTGRGRGTQRGTVETEGRTRYILLRLSLSVRATRLAVATRRSIDAPRRRSSLSLSLAIPSCLPTGVSVTYARVELLRSRAAGVHTRRGRERGVSGDPRTSGYRSATPLCARFLFPLVNPPPLSTGSVLLHPTLLRPCLSRSRHYRKYGGMKRIRA